MSYYEYFIVVVLLSKFPSSQSAKINIIFYSEQGYALNSQSIMTRHQSYVRLVGSFEFGPLSNCSHN